MAIKILLCEFNIDTACVELKLTDGETITIDCTAVENELVDNMHQRPNLASLNSQTAWPWLQFSNISLDFRSDILNEAV